MISEFNLEFLISSIETLCKQKSISVKSALEECGLKRVVVDNMKKGSVPSVDKIYTLANFFGVSVDYLLGRTDEPNAIYSISGSNNTQAINNGNNSQITVTTGEPAKTDTTTAELVKLIQSLPLLKRAEAILYLNNIIKDT